jgi:spore maturation protein CgeB
MTERPLSFVVLGLSITSSWGNGHATTYRSLLSGLHRLGHRVLFLERDQPWYAEHRDLPRPGFARTELYHSVSELKTRFAAEVRNADVVIVGSYVPDGVEIGAWVTRTARGLPAFYDIDTPVTLSRLAAGDDEYITRSLIPRYELYLSFTGGPALELLERRFGSPRARALYCATDLELYGPESQPLRWDLAYMGTYSADRQPSVERLLTAVARVQTERRFAVIGPQYPESLQWAPNVERTSHLPPDRHRAFYNSQRFTLNITRADMRAAGYSPSVRLFEAAACGTAIISDDWPGLETLFEPDREILIAHDTADVVDYLQHVSDDERQRIGARARARVLAHHTGRRRAEELIRHVREAHAGQATIAADISS